MLFTIIASLCMVFPIINVNADVCYTPSGYNSGVDSNKCQEEMKYCETTGECIRGSTCPVCKHNDIPEAKYFCTTNGKDECCDYPCTSDEECESPIGYELGDINDNRCNNNEGYCESKDECISSTGRTCPICPRMKPFFCQLLGGGVCCNTLDESCTNYKPMCEEPKSYGSGVLHNKCKTGKYCESKDECITGNERTCPVCDPFRPQWCQLLGGGMCCDRLDDRCTNYPRTECGDNKNSGPQGVIQCTSNRDCCDGYKCKLDKAKCIPTDESVAKASGGPPMGGAMDNNYNAAANDIEEYHSGSGGKSCSVNGVTYKHGEVIRDIKQECVGWGAAAKSFTTESEVCENGKVKTATFENECNYGICCPYGDYVGCTSPDCEPQEGRKCYQFGKEYNDGDVVEHIGYQCEGWGGAQSKMSVVENVCRDGTIKYEERDAPCANNWACCQMDRSAYCVPNWNECPSNNNAANALPFGGRAMGDYDNNNDVNRDEIEVLATATFSRSESGVDGTVKIDENGNVFVNLDISSLDTSVCNFNNAQDVELEYALYDQFDYGDLKSRAGDQCTKEIIGEIYNPFNGPKCSEYNGTGDKYFECAIGDLSGRFGYARVSDSNKIKENGNVSEKNGESGFCAARLVPEEMYQRSVVFTCNDSKKTVVFCAPFEITAKKL